MSHRIRHPELSGEWRLAVERALQYCRDSHSFLLASVDTPLGPFLIQAAQRLQVPVVELRLPLPQESLADWEQRTCDEFRSSSGKNSTAVQWWVSPIDKDSEDRMMSIEVGSARDEAIAFDNYPLVDRALMAFADKVRVISVAPGSKTEWLVHQRLADDRFPTASVFIAMKAEPNDRVNRFKKKSNRTSEMLRGFLDRGAVGCFHSECRVNSRSEGCHSGRGREHIESLGGEPRVPATFVPRFHYREQMPRWSNRWPYLSHCTRACVGAWPDQSQTGYYDSIISANRIEDLHATAFETLKRILLQQRLVASNHLNRTDLPTVSLTEVPLETLLPRRQFQSHLGRWDWESYGICIHRDWVEQHGGRRVLYSNAVRWGELDVSDRPYFQPTRDAESADRAEWELEREWRVVGDIHLANIPFESAVAFVPSKLEAEKLASISRFPIMIV